jgi:lipopolysaccharide biosynthesis glycosyltransferase
MDCDMLVLKDITKLWSLRDSRYAVMCTKHDHIPREKKKALGVPQKIYDKKNWSSLMLMNCAKCAALTPNYVNNTKGLALHQFDWLKSDKQIGSIPLKWNHLVDFQEIQPLKKIANLHYTLGGPYLNDYTNCGYATVWINELQNMINSKQTQYPKHVKTKKQPFLKLFKQHLKERI